MSYKHIFGPVLSRRLGVSLGVDLVLHKTCSMDCIYCECGRTTVLSMEQKEVVRFDIVKSELDHYLKNNNDPDFITFSGSGEPCLNPCLGKVIEYIKEQRPDIKVAVLTNSTLIDKSEVRKALLKADLVIPSLDAASKTAFEKINRPHKSVDLDGMINGLIKFSKEFKGKLWLETLILPGINDGEQDLLLLKQAIEKINPDMVQLNTLDRPGTESDICPAVREELEKVVKVLKVPDIEIIAKAQVIQTTRTARKDLKAAISETIHRRPCTIKDLSQTLGFTEKIIAQHIDTLEKENKIFSTTRERGIFYQTRKE